MNRGVFHTDKAPQTKGSYSQAIIDNGILYLSGHGRYCPGAIEEEARTALNNLKTNIKKAGHTLEDLLKVTCYLSSMDDFARFNEIYSEYFPDVSLARTTIQAGRLPMDFKVEIDVIVGQAEEAWEKTGLEERVYCTEGLFCSPQYNGVLCSELAPFCLGQNRAETSVE